MTKVIHPAVRLYGAISDIYTEYLISGGLVTITSFTELEELLVYYKEIQEKDTNPHPGIFSTKVLEFLQKVGYIIYTDLVENNLVLRSDKQMMIESLLDIIHLEYEDRRSKRADNDFGKVVAIK